MSWAYHPAHILKKKETAICIVISVKLEKNPPGLDHTTRLRAADLCSLPANSGSDGAQAGARFFSVSLWSIQCLGRDLVSSFALRALCLSGLSAPCCVLVGVSGQACDNGHGFHVFLFPRPVRGFFAEILYGLSRAGFKRLEPPGQSGYLRQRGAFV